MDDTTGYPNQFQFPNGNAAETRAFVRSTELRIERASPQRSYVMTDKGVRIPTALLLRLPALRRRIGRVELGQ